MVCCFDLPDLLVGNPKICIPSADFLYVWENNFTKSGTFICECKLFFVILQPKNDIAKQ